MATAQPGARHPLTELIHVQRNPEAPRHKLIRHTTILGVLTRHDRMLYSRARQKDSKLTSTAPSRGLLAAMNVNLLFKEQQRTHIHGQD